MVTGLREDDRPIMRCCLPRFYTMTFEIFDAYEMNSKVSLPGCRGVTFCVFGASFRGSFYYCYWDIKPGATAKDTL